MPETEAQKRATEKWREKNRKRATINSARSSCKTFIRRYATLEELDEIKKLIEEVKAQKEKEEE